MRSNPAKRGAPLLVGLLLAAACSVDVGGLAGPDASSAPRDAAAGPVDAAPSPADAAALGEDASLPGTDAAEPPDAASPGLDATVPGPDAGPTCALTAAGPVAVTRNGQVLEHLRITGAATGPAVLVEGFSDVVIRDCEIHHKKGAGIRFTNAARIRIEDVHIVHESAPASGANADDGRNNLEGEFSSGVVVTRAKLERGSSGIYLLECPAAQLSFIEGHDFRGPMPRGQLVQFNHCDGAVLEDFSSECPAATAWTEDNVSVFQSANVTIRRGLVDGNNSPSGVGVMFELSDGSSGGLCEDVDAVRQGNGCFSGYPATGVTYRRTRARDNVCTDQGRGEPLSGGLAWAGSPDSSNLRIEDSTYFNLCAGLVWDEGVFTAQVLTEADFTLRAPQRLKFCWE